MSTATETSPTEAFEASRARFETLVDFLDGDGAVGLSHSELEDRLQSDGRELMRQLFQDHFDLGAAREPRLAEVLDASGVRHGAVEAGHHRPLTTVFGEVEVERLAYRHRGSPNLCPATGC